MLSPSLIKRSAAAWGFPSAAVTIACKEESFNLASALNLAASMYSNKLP